MLDLSNTVLTSCELTKHLIEKYQPSAQGSQNTSLTYSLKAGTINTIADLVAFVKGYDKNYQPRPVNPALLNEDGTQKVLQNYMLRKIEMMPKYFI